MSSVISATPLDIAKLNQQFTEQLQGAGAMVTFTGFVRDFNANGELQGLELEHYPKMTEKAMHRLIDETKQRFSCIQVHAVHRVGRITNYEPIVWVANCAFHRKEAFDASMYLMDMLKQSVPLWKKEWQNGKATWVAAKASDEQSAMRWMTNKS